MAKSAAPRPLRLLLAVVAAMLVTLAVDIYGAIAMQGSTDELVDDAFRSVTLVEDLRWQVHVLASGEATVTTGDVVAQLDADIAAYAPLADFEDELAVWQALRAELTPLREEARRGDRAAVARRALAVSALVEHLVAINLRSAAHVTDGLGGERRREIVIDAIVVLLIAALLVRLGIGFQRALTHEAELIARNLAMVQEQNRELEAFAGRAAHDLRAPLNPIRGFAELIVSDGEAPPELQRMGALIGKGVARMSRVIDDMLELSRSGQAAPGVAHARTITVAVIDELAPELRDAEVEVEVEPLILACRDTALEQLLRNLLGNSAKYRSPERRLHIALSVRARDGRAVIEVVDNGTGMDAEAARHAFDPFFRARPDVAGTGLGLAIVERIARAYGGSCTLDSSRDQGTTVTVTLPIAA